MMKKLLLIFLLLPCIANAAAPSRTYNYVSHTTIDPVQNNTNENALYSYLQAGVDTYSAGSITNTAVSSSAAIAYSKLNLIGAITNADISASSGIVGSKLDLTAPGIIGSVTPAAGTFTNLEATGTFKAGTTHQGDVFYDNGTSVVRLTPGTTGQFLKTQGASANPVWESTANSQFFASSGSFTAPATVTKVFLTMCAGGGGGGNSTSGGTTGSGGGGGGGACVINYPYTVTGSSVYTVTVGAGGVGAADGVDSVFDALTISKGLKGVDGTSVSTQGNGGVGGSSAATPLPLFSASATTATVATVGGGGVIPGGNGGKATANDTSGSGGGTAFGIGAAGKVATANSNGVAATANTGAGGGGASGGGGTGFTGGTGGSGFVLVQY